MSIKIIEGLEPWEVMKRASEGEPVAMLISSPRFIRVNVTVDSNNNLSDPRIEPTDEWELIEKPHWNWGEQTYAIIDTREPVIDWSKFDVEFFHQYGASFKKHLPTPGMYGVHSSPFYYWPGGECPVPENVEVEIIFNNAAGGRTLKTGVAKHIIWNDVDLIAFRITGNVL